MVDVSVIMPVYKVEKYVRDSVRSVAEQTYKNIEIILVDDCSPDRSGEICDELAAEDSRIKVIHKEKNEGTGMARNTGIDASVGTYLYFCDPDDTVEPGLIEDNLRLLRENDADLILFGYNLVNYNIRSSVPEKSTFVPVPSGVRTYEEFWRGFDEHENSAPELWAFMFRRALVEKHALRFSSLSTGQDVYFLYDVYSVPFNKIVYNPRAYYNYMYRAGTATNSYKPERIKNAYLLAVRLEELLRNSPYDKSLLEEKITRGYISSLSHGIRNIPRAKVSVLKKAALIKEAASMERFAGAVKNVRLSSLKSGAVKIRVLFLKLGLYLPLALVQEIFGRRG